MLCLFVSSLQMLMVLEALVPCYLQKLKSNSQALESASVARDEIAAIAALATSLQALLYSVEALTRFVPLSLSTLIPHPFYGQDPVMCFSRVFPCGHLKSKFLVTVSVSAENLEETHINYV